MSIINRHTPRTLQKAISINTLLGKALEMLEQLRKIGKRTQHIDKQLNDIEEGEQLSQLEKSFDDLS